MKTHYFVASAAVAALLIGLTASALGGLHGAQDGAAVTARWAFVWFITAWSASSLARLWPGGWRTALLRRRRAIGLGFAASHFVHLGFVIAPLSAGAERSMITFVFGGAAYVLIAAMAATSNNVSVKAMGPKAWKLLHSIGGWYVAFIFANSYVGRLFSDDKMLIGAFGTGLLALAIGLRIAAFAKGRMRLQAA